MAAQAVSRRSSRISPRRTRGVQVEQDLESVTTAMPVNTDDERDHRHHRRHIESMGSAIEETSPDDERDTQKRPLAQTAGARRLRVPDEATLLEVDDGEWVAGALATGTATAVDTIAVPELSPREEHQRVRALNTAATAAAAASHRNLLTDESHIAAGLEQREDFLRAFRHLRWTGNAAPRRLGALLLPARSSRLRLRASRDDHGFRLFKRNPSWFIALNIQAGIRLSLQQLELHGLTGGELDERDFFSSFVCDVGAVGVYGAAGVRPHTATVRHLQQGGASVGVQPRRPDGSAQDGHPSGALPVDRHAAGVLSPRAQLRPTDAVAVVSGAVSDTDAAAATYPLCDGAQHLPVVVRSAGKVRLEGQPAIGAAHQAAQDDERGRQGRSTLDIHWGATAGHPAQRQSAAARAHSPRDRRAVPVSDPGQDVRQPDAGART
eukprot:ctg_1427.g462